MENKILSFDVSSVSTGWSILTDGKLKHFGTLRPLKDYSLQMKLYWFGKQVRCLVNLYKPDVILVEDTYYKNTKTLKTLMQFMGTAQFVCYPYWLEIVNVNTVRSKFKVKNKEEAFDFVKNKFKRKLKHFNFEDDNDITDSILQALYWIEKDK